MLPCQELELFLAQRKYHESFLQQGGLGVLKGWLEPYFDGTLPTMRVRTAVLKGLQVRRGGRGGHAGGRTGQAPCMLGGYTGCVCAACG